MLRTLLIFSFVTAGLAATASVLFSSTVILPEAIAFVAFIAFGVSLALAGLNTFLTRPSDKALGKFMLFGLYMFVMYYGIDSAFMTPVGTTVGIGGSPGLSIFIGALAGVIHFLLLSTGDWIFRYPPEDPLPQKFRPKPRIVKK